MRTVVADYQVRMAEPGFRLAFGGPEFEAAVHAVVDPLAGPPAFLTHDEPPIRTGPIVVTLYAGGGPRPDPGPLSDPTNVRTALCDEAWPEVRAALRLWHPVCEDHFAPISLFADLAQPITPDRGREILATPEAPAPASIRPTVPAARDTSTVRGKGMTEESDGVVMR